MPGNEFQYTADWGSVPGRERCLTDTGDFIPVTDENKRIVFFLEWQSLARDSFVSAEGEL